MLPVIHSLTFRYVKVNLFRDILVIFALIACSPHYILHKSNHHVFCDLFFPFDYIENSSKDVVVALCDLKSLV